jgi:hypothetical protein
LPPIFASSHFPGSLSVGLARARARCRSQDMELQLWLMKHLCENCGGTLTPIDGYVAECSEDGLLIQSGEEGVEKAVHTCNSCGARRPDRVFDMIVQAEMAAAGVDEDSDGDSGGDTDGDEDSEHEQSHEDDSGQEYDDVD